MWKKFWCQFVMYHFMSLSKLEKNLTKWNEACKNNWGIPKDRKSEREKQIEKTFIKVEWLLDKAWKDHIKRHIERGWEIPYQFYIEEENDYGITIEDINVFDDLGETVSFRNHKYQVRFPSSDDEDIDSYKRLKVTVQI